MKLIGKLKLTRIPDHVTNLDSSFRGPENGGSASWKRSDMKRNSVTIVFLCKPLAALGSVIKLSLRDFKNTLAAFKYLRCV